MSLRMSIHTSVHVLTQGAGSDVRILHRAPRTAAVSEPRHTHTRHATHAAHAHCTAPHRTALRCTALHGLHRTALHRTALLRTTLPACPPAHPPTRPPARPHGTARQWQGSARLLWRDDPVFGDGDRHTAPLHSRSIYWQISYYGILVIGDGDRHTAPLHSRSKNTYLCFNTYVSTYAPCSRTITR